MDIVALCWARMGWARFLQGDNLAASQFLDAAWELSQSGTVANRLARVYEKTGARDRARHMFALAATTGGADAESSRREMTKLGATNVEKDLSQAAVELGKMRVMSLPPLSSQPASAHFALLFDNSSSPDRVQFLEGDQSLRPAAEKLQKLDYPVRFPDVSSVKIIRLGAVSCSASECKLTLQPLNSTVPGHESLQASTLVQSGSSTHEATTNLKTPEQAGSSAVQIVGVPAASGTTPPRLISAPDPVYTDAARRAMLQGIVVVSLVVGADGLVRDPHILTSLRHDLDDSALQAVREWKFEPATKNGQPVEVHVNVQVSFRLYQEPSKN